MILEDEKQFKWKSDEHKQAVYWDTFETLRHYT
jgi:hypothetical protein